jgi:hypothetical protein
VVSLTCLLPRVVEVGKQINEPAGEPSVKKGSYIRPGQIIDTPIGGASETFSFCNMVLERSLLPQIK